MDEVSQVRFLEAKLDALRRLGQALILLREEQRIAESVLQIAEEVLDFGDCDFLLVDEVRGELYVAARRGEMEEAGALRLPLDGERGITVAAARTGETVYVPDVRGDPRYVDTGFDAVSDLAVPVQVEGRVLGVINVESREPDAFSDTDARLLSTLASQAALALENARFCARERRRVEEMAAVNAVARRISATLDFQETLDAIVAAAADLVPCALAEISLWDEERQMLTLQALRCTPERSFPIGETFPPGEGYTGWVVRHKQPLLVQDVDTFEDIRPDILPGELPFKAYVGLPLLAGDELIGTLVLIHDEAGVFDEEDFSLLKALAGQAAVAIYNARLFEELSRRHGELATLYTVAEAVNRPLDLEDLLQHALDRVIEVTNADGGAIRLFEPQSSTLVLASHRGLSETYVQAADRFPLSEEIVGWVARTAQPSLSEDMWTDPRVSAEVRELLKEVGHRSLAQVPLRAQDRVVGTLGVVTRIPGFFHQDDLNLLNAIGQQLGVAIENARLYTDLAQRARELEAIHAVAAAVNRPGELKEILEEGLKQALAVTGFEIGAISLRNLRDNSIIPICFQGMPPEFLAQTQARLPGKRFGPWPEGLEIDVYVKEVQPDAPETPEHLRQAGIRLVVNVPLFAEGEYVGVLDLAAARTQPLTTEERSLLLAIGHQLGVAIGNARLLEETQRRARRLAALNAVAAAINQALDLDALLFNAVDTIIDVVGVDAAAVRLIDPQTNRLNVAFGRGLSPEYTAMVGSYALDEGPARHLVLEGEPILVEDMMALREWPPHVRDMLEKEGVRSRAEVPLRSQERVVGTLGVVSRTPAAFGPEDVDLLTAIGHQLGVAIENAHLRQQALEAERLAAVGRVAGTVAHDLRSPLGGIIRSAEFLARPEISEATRQKLSQATVAMARRLINTAQEILDYTRGGQMALHLAWHALPEFLEQVLEVLRVDFSDRGIEVVEEWGYTGAVEIDADRMAQVVYNIAANARDAMPKGGRLEVASREVGEWVEIRFTDTGPGVPPELAERVFEPFISYGKREGAGLGLSIARRIVEEHGGEIWVESPAGGGAAFVVRLPLKGQAAPTVSPQGESSPAE